MSIDELSSVLKVSTYYLQTHWNRVIESRKKQGIEIIKVGRGQNAIYGIKFPWDLDYAWSTDELDMIE